MGFAESPSRSRFLIEHDLFGKPLHTFPDHAPGSAPAIHARETRQRITFELFGEPPLGRLRRGFAPQFLATRTAMHPASRTSRKVTPETRCARKRPAFAGVLALYLLAALRERILFIFPSE